jgi:AmmeMemoRadiSam system protein B
LLPGVAVEHHLDAEAFLRQVCLKAGLPIDAWRDDESNLSTFEGYAIHGDLGQAIASLPEASSAGGPTLADLAQLADFCRGNLIAHAYGATPSYYLPGGYDGGVNGVVLTVHLPGRDETVDSSALSLRPELPLQSALLDLTKAAADSLVSGRVGPAAIEASPCGISVFWDPAMHGSAEAPDLAGVDPRRRALVIAGQARWVVVYDPSRSAEELFEEGLTRLGLAEPVRGSVYSLAAMSTEPRVVASNAPPPQPKGYVRAPAVAGRFYPGRPEEIERTLDELVPAERKAGRWAGVLVPHAGWIYSGRLAAQALSRIDIPSRAIVVCPKHHSDGADWAIAPCGSWVIPGREIESDLELAQALADSVPEFRLDADAHRHEHAIEVQLAFLARLAPKTRVVGIAIHGGDFQRLARSAERLAGVLGRLDQRPLLVISSDMNHYADDDRTRRLDRMALDAIESLDPARLLETVTKNRITMCGVLPAVLVMETLRQLGSLNRCEIVGYATSADASGDRSRVVGYAAALFA